MAFDRPESIVLMLVDWRILVSAPCHRQILLSSPAALVPRCNGGNAIAGAEKP
jgi:hypothetical protein